MTVATLASADTRLYAALAALVTAPVATSTPFASLDRWEGPVPTTGLPAPKFPAVMLRFDGEQPVDRDVRTFGWEGHDRSRANWTVLVQLYEPQEASRAVNGSASVPGILRLVDAVKGACNGLALDGASMEQKIRFAGTARETGTVNTTLVYAVRFVCELDAPDAYAAQVAADTSPDVEEVRSDINIEGTGTPAPNPLVQIVSEPNP